MRHIVEDLGFLYYQASNKEELLFRKNDFLCANCGKPVIFEVFINPDDEVEVSHLVRNIESEIWPMVKNNIRSVGVALKRKIDKS